MQKYVNIADGSSWIHKIIQVQIFNCELQENVDKLLGNGCVAHLLLQFQAVFFELLTFFIWFKSVCVMKFDVSWALRLTLSVPRQL